VSSTSPAARPIEACPPAFASLTGPSTWSIRSLNDAPSTSARPVTWPILTSPDAMLARSASARSSRT
jgi:hypothetical protein